MVERKTGNSAAVVEQKGHLPAALEFKFLNEHS